MDTKKRVSNTSKALMMGTALITLTSFSQEANAASLTTAAISAIVLDPIIITENTIMNFGRLTVDGASAGTIAMDTTSVRNPTGGVTPVGAVGFSAANFTIQSAAGVAIDITVPAGVVNISDGFANTMAVSQFDLVAGTATVTNTLAVTPVGTTNTVNVGATLNVAAAQTPGTYTGQYTINVDYQ